MLYTDKHSINDEQTIRYRVKDGTLEDAGNVNLFNHNVVCSKEIDYCSVHNE